MISDKDLQEAARAREKAILDALPGPEECPAAFSPAFERKMKKLIFRTDHPALWLLCRLLPVALLLAGAAAALLAGGAGRPTAAPSAPPEAVQSQAPVVYRPTWLPEGCVSSRENFYDNEGMIVYRAGEGEAVFLYAVGGDPAEGEDLQQGRAVLVNGRPGVLRLGQSKGALNDLFWTDGDAAFWLSAPYGEEVLLRIAESVEAQPAPEAEKNF